MKPTYLVLQIAQKRTKEQVQKARRQWELEVAETKVRNFDQTGCFVSTRNLRVKYIWGTFKSGRIPKRHVQTVTVYKLVATCRRSAINNHFLDVINS